MQTTQQFPALRSERRTELFRREERYVPFLENFTHLSPLAGADEAISHFAQGGQARPVAPQPAPNSQCTGKKNYTDKNTVLPFHWERNLEAVEAFRTVLCERRLQAGLTQEQLAFEADIRRNYVSMLEPGQNQPTLSMLFTLPTALGCTPSDLLLEVEQRPAAAGRVRKKKEVKPSTPKWMKDGRPQYRGSRHANVELKVHTYA